MTTSLLRIRTAAIETVGVTVLRFTNSDVDNHFPSVCQQMSLTNDSTDKKEESP